jgi:hypothetical protein
MFISDNILVVALILLFGIISWFTYKSIKDSIPDLDEEQEDEVEDNSELELESNDSDEEFLQYAQEVLESEREKIKKENDLSNKLKSQKSNENQKQKKLSETLKNNRPVVTMEVAENNSSKPITKNIRVNKKNKNADSKKTD